MNEARVSRSELPAKLAELGMMGYAIVTVVPLTLNMETVACGQISEYLIFYIHNSQRGTGRP